MPVTAQQALLHHGTVSETLGMHTRVTGDMRKHSSYGMVHGIAKHQLVSHFMHVLYMRHYHKRKKIRGEIFSL